MYDDGNGTMHTKLYHYCEINHPFWFAYEYQCDAAIWQQQQQQFNAKEKTNEKALTHLKLAVEKHLFKA